MKKITKYVIDYSDIPEELTEGHWINDYTCQDSYVEAHIDVDEEDGLSLWLKQLYPELINEESFLIHIDY